MALDKHPMWRLPKHHLDCHESHDHVHWVELFYDLIHVVIIFLLGNYLGQHLTLSGFFSFAGIFIAVWFAWADSSAFNSVYVSTDIKHRLIMSMQVVTAMIMAAAIPSIDTQGWSYFAVAYAINRFITGYLYYRTQKLGVEQSRFAAQMSRNFWLLSIMFVVSAFIPKPYSYGLFAAGIIIVQALYVLPKIGILENPRSLPRLGHMAERFALLLLIVVGEGFFKLVLTLAAKGIAQVSPSIFFNFIFAGFCTFILCWLYFDFVGNGKPKNHHKWTLFNWWLAHLLLMLAAVMIGVAVTGEVKVGFLEPYPFNYSMIGCSGLILYLSALLWIQVNIERRIAHRFATVKVRLIGIALAILALITVPFVPAIVGNVFWGAALISQIVIPVTRAYRAFADEDDAVDG